MRKAENKTKDYILRATKTYQNKFDRIVILAPQGTKDKIKAFTGESINGYINRLVREDLEKRETTPGE